MPQIASGNESEQHYVQVPAQPSLSEDFSWDPAINIIRSDGHFIYLSISKGRIFDLLLRNRCTRVSLYELIKVMQPSAANDDIKILHRLRFAITRLRSKTRICATLKNRIVSTHDSGYVFI